MEDRSEGHIIVVGRCCRDNIERTIPGLEWRRSAITSNWELNAYTGGDEDLRVASEGDEGKAAAVLMILELIIALLGRKRSVMGKTVVRIKARWSSNGSKVSFEEVIVVGYQSGRILSQEGGYGLSEGWYCRREDVVKQGLRAGVEVS